MLVWCRHERLNVILGDLLGCIMWKRIILVFLTNSNVDLVNLNAFHFHQLFQSQLGCTVGFPTLTSGNEFYKCISCSMNTKLLLFVPNLSLTRFFLCPVLLLEETAENLSFILSLKSWFYRSLFLSSHHFPSLFFSYEGLAIPSVIILLWTFSNSTISFF